MWITKREYLDTLHEERDYERMRIREDISSFDATIKGMKTAIIKLQREVNSLIQLSDCINEMDNRISEMDERIKELERKTEELRDELEETKAKKGQNVQIFADGISRRERRAVNAEYGEQPVGEAEADQG